MGKHTTDPSLWAVRPAFGVAGGPNEVVLTDEGNARAFSIGAKVRRGAAAEALEALSVAGGAGLLSERSGSKLRRTALGKFDQIAWGHLRSLGYVESFQDERGDGVRLTLKGFRACEDALIERGYLLQRCREAHASSLALAALEHAQQNVRTLTGGDERRIATAIEALKKAGAK